MMRGQRETLLSCTGKGPWSQSAELESTLVHSTESWHTREREGFVPVQEQGMRDKASWDVSSSPAAWVQTPMGLPAMNDYFFFSEPFSFFSEERCFRTLSSFFPKFSYTVDSSFCLEGFREILACAFLTAGG